MKCMETGLSFNFYLKKLNFASSFLEADCLSVLYEPDSCSLDVFTKTISAVEGILVS